MLLIMRQSEKSLLLIILDPTDDSLGLNSMYLVFLFIQQSHINIWASKEDVITLYSYKKVLWKEV